MWVLTPPAYRSGMSTVEATLTCPECGHASRETMPTEACQFFYRCDGFGMLLRPRSGDCCVFCSYADIRCPPKQPSPLIVSG